MCKIKSNVKQQIKTGKSNYLSCLHSFYFIQYLPKTVVNQRISLVFREDPMKEEICTLTPAHDTLSLIISFI
jgi:hypothetical protein